MLRANPNPLKHGLIAGVSPKRCQPGIDAEKHARTEVRVNHPFNVV
jgi:hypothetical protein